MKNTLLPAIAGFTLILSLQASPTIGVPTKQLNPIDTIKTVIVYALGEWDNLEHSHHYSQNTPFPVYAFDIQGLTSDQYALYFNK